MNARKALAALLVAACAGTGCVEYSWVRVAGPSATHSCVAQPGNGDDTRTRASDGEGARSGVLYNIVALAPEVAEVVKKDPRTTPAEATRSSRAPEEGSPSRNR